MFLDLFDGQRIRQSSAFKGAVFYEIRLDPERPEINE